VKSAWSELLPLALRHGVPARGFGPEEIAGALLRNGRLTQQEQLEVRRICARHGIVPVESADLRTKRGREAAESKMRMMVLEIVEQTGGCTEEKVARKLGLHRHSARKWLRRLMENGDVMVVNAGPRRIWRPAEVGR